MAADPQPPGAPPPAGDSPPGKDTPPRNTMPLRGSGEPLAALYDVALLDLDGVVYLGGSPIPGAADSLIMRNSAWAGVSLFMAAMAEIDFPSKALFAG